MGAYSKIKQDLFSFKSEKLSKLSICLILILDIFILSLLFEGIDNEQKQLVKPYEAISYTCQQVFNQKDEQRYSSFYNKYTVKHIVEQEANADQRCLDLKDKYQAVINSPEFIANKELINTLNSQIRRVSNELRTLSARYDTRLLETIAKKADQSDNLKTEYDNLLIEEQNLQRKLRSVKRLTNLEVYQSFVAYKNLHKKQIQEEYKSLKIWYKIKSFLMSLKFTLPLFLIAFFFYFKNKQNQLKGNDFNNIALIISAHLSIIFALPIILGILETIYLIIPKTFLAKIYIMLESMKALFLGFYGLMLLAILIFGFIIYQLQKFEKKKHRKYSVIAKSISKSKCFNCKNTVDYKNDKFCSFCNQELLEQCEDCSKFRIKGLPFCRHCGTQKSNQD
tara:strand:+ start:540 stop:1721 length:1182 start_codon:yes stop_codon:yes gene_type:complete